MLHKFDRKNETLIDYFVILGPSRGTLKTLINELHEGKDYKNEGQYARMQSLEESSDSSAFQFEQSVEQGIEEERKSINIEEELMV